ncbi:DUF6348 family protein [Mucilaginibacter pedocola]|uniref:Uncharacterized protein n=1 Tax=Mucilaginibacter pedocola TaxID=1792845 RepID=A0A1S9PLZ6_9SPHI|nr:DUF6348 family protein [Mucilaginibacter pedocola]OOQ61588.1 hypothetical protein BC343_00475 [Mucilaginibacter pedocola]
MGLFDLFKTKQPEPIRQPEQPPINKNFLLLLAFEAKLKEMGYEVERHPKYLALIVNGDVELGFMVVDTPGTHPSLMQLMVAASHAKYYPKGIIEELMGIGQTLEAQILSGVNSYINSTFLTVMDGFADSHQPEFDFLASINNHEVLQHPKLGNLIMQGKWEETPQGEPLFDLLKDIVKTNLTRNKINWLKIYISKRADGTIIGECTFNNDPWDEATDIIYNYAESWSMPGEFKALKQFILFRRCDKYDELVD